MHHHFPLTPGLLIQLQANISLNPRIFSSHTPWLEITVCGFGSVRCHGTGNAAIASHVKNSAYNVTLKDSLHVPEAPFNLISIGRITDAGFSVQFDGDWMHVYSKDSKRQEIMCGKKIGALYHVKITRAVFRSTPIAFPASEPSLAITAPTVPPVSPPTS
ncbi:hypothetical protein C8J57DRAFT_1185353, partial [Mycena rebaudengoi]